MNKKRISLIVFIIGIIALLAGVIFLIVRLNTTPSISDGEYLVTVGEWVREGEECEQLKCAEDTKCIDENGESAVRCNNSGVIWNFTEIGKGTLTTNDHLNDYDFTWVVEDGMLKIRTEWLYEMDDEFEYKLDQNGKVLTIIKDEEEINFVPLVTE